MRPPKSSHGETAYRAAMKAGDIPAIFNFPGDKP